MSRSGSTAAGYSYRGSIVKNALTAGEDIPICLATSISNTNPA
jgi:hypothetical protein